MPPAATVATATTATTGAFPATTETNRWQLSNILAPLLLPLPRLLWPSVRVYRP